MVLKRSVGVLLKLISKNLRADAVALSQSGGEHLGFATSLLIPIIPPSVNLFVGWHDAKPTPDVTKLAPVIEGLRMILGKNNQERDLQTLLARLTHLQWELADSKIAERTAGLIASGEAEPAKIQEHIERVLQSIDDFDALSKRIKDLESEIASRKQIAAAKAMLQKTRGLSEQQSYLHLQRLSRRTRRALTEVANEILSLGLELSPKSQPTSAVPFKEIFPPNTSCLP